MAVLLDTSYLRQYIIHSRHFKEEIIKDPEIFSYGFLNTLLQISKTFGCSKKNKLILATDNKKKYTYNGKTRRGYWRDLYFDKNKKFMFPNNKYEHYKSGRQQDDKLDWDTLNKLYYDILDVLDKYSDFTVMSIDGLEADDIIAVLAQKAKTETTIIANDKDLKQLINNNVKYYNYSKKEYEYDIKTSKELIVFYLGGDFSDAISGVLPNTRWKNLIINKNLSLDESIQTLVDKKQKELEKLINKNKPYSIEKYPDSDTLKQRYKINKKLMDLSLDNLPNFVIKKTLEKIKENHFKYNQMRLLNELNKFNLNKHLVGNVKSILDISRLKEFRLNDFDIREHKTIKKQKEKISKNNDRLADFL